MGRLSRHGADVTAHLRRLASLLRREWPYWAIPFVLTLAALLYVGLSRVQRDAVRMLYDLTGR